MTGGADGGRGTALGRGARCAGFDGGCGGTGLTGGTGGGAGASLAVSGARIAGVSPDPGIRTFIGGSSHSAAMWIRIDSAMVTQILGITTPSFLLRNTSLRSVINRLLPCRDWGFPGDGVDGVKGPCPIVSRLAKYIESDLWNTR